MEDNVAIQLLAKQSAFYDEETLEIEKGKAQDAQGHSCVYVQMAHTILMRHQDTCPEGDGIKGRQRELLYPKNRSLLRSHGVRFACTRYSPLRLNDKGTRRRRARAPSAGQTIRVAGDGDAVNNSEA
jgi:hypothetical protein